MLTGECALLREVVVVLVRRGRVSRSLCVGKRRLLCKAAFGGERLSWRFAKEFLGTVSFHQVSTVCVYGSVTLL